MVHKIITHVTHSDIGMCKITKIHGTRTIKNKFHQQIENLHQNPFSVFAIDCIPVKNNFCQSLFLCDYTVSDDLYVITIETWLGSSVVETANNKYQQAMTHRCDGDNSHRVGGNALIA